MPCGHLRIPARSPGLGGCAIVALLALGLGVAPASGASRCSAGLRGKGVKVLAKTTSAIVYKSPFVNRAGGGRRTEYKVFGCSTGIGRAFYLDTDFFDGSSEDQAVTSHIRLAGPYVGYAAEQDSHDGAETNAVVVDLRTGKRVVDTYAVENKGSGVATIDSLVLSPSGNVAWVGHDQATGPGLSPIYEVRKSDSAGLATLDTGADMGTIDPRSLRLSAGQLTWTNAGMARTAQLP